MTIERNLESFINRDIQALQKRCINQLILKLHVLQLSNGYPTSNITYGGVSSKRSLDGFSQQTKTSFQLWTCLGKSFGSQSKAKLMQLKLRLQSTKKDSSSINLALVGYLVSSDDFIMHLLHGILLEYHVFITDINSQHIPLDIEELHALLLSQSM